MPDENLEQLPSFVVGERKPCWSASVAKLVRLCACCRERDIGLEALLLELDFKPLWTDRNAAGFVSIVGWSWRDEARWEMYSCFHSAVMGVCPNDRMCGAQSASRYRRRDQSAAPRTVTPTW